LHQLDFRGTDGGLLPVPYDVETLVMAQGERYDVMFVGTEDEGAEIPLIDEPYERGHESGTRPATELRASALAPGHGWLRGQRHRRALPSSVSRTPTKPSRCA